MPIFLVGLSYRTTPVEIRECLHLSTAEQMSLLVWLRYTLGVESCAVVSTCNRMEVYGVADQPDHIVGKLTQHLEHERKLNAGSLSAYLYVQYDHATAVQLMRVASGLDSMVLGEAQILGQVAGAYALSKEINTTDAQLSRLFEMALHVGKRARAETEIGEHTTSVSHAAVLLALSAIESSADITALVVGAGNMASLAVDAFRSKGVDRVNVVNRTPSHAKELALRSGGRAHGWHELGDALAAADIIISATSAPHTVIHVDDVQLAMNKRDYRRQVLIDTAVPRDVGAGVEKIPGIVFYNIDELQRVVDENYARREACVPLVESMIAEEVDRFMTWLRSREVVPAIKDLRQKVSHIADAELEQTLHLLVEEDRELVTRMVHRIVNKVLHEPTVRLREQAATDASEIYVHAVRDLFDLKNEPHA